VTQTALLPPQPGAEPTQIPSPSSAPGDLPVARMTRWDRTHATLSETQVTKPVRALGNFFAMALDTLMLIPRRPFAVREFWLQSWFVARVSLLPTLMLAIPFTVLLIFTFNILLVEFGAADYSGTGAAYGTVTQVGPVVTVLVVAGAGATAMCADLGARTIREEIDALRVMGVNPIQALVVRRSDRRRSKDGCRRTALTLVGRG
jgi:phospholipid/cholesterol/gamma-HCH transport system permease protein